MLRCAVTKTASVVPHRLMTNKILDRKFSLAPMMDWSDRHCRYFWRLLTQRAVVYSEMVTTGALIYGDAHRHLEYNNEEHPIALQLGGSKPEDLAKACKWGEQYGYDEINLNVGCPSDRVQNNMIGACLMAHADLVNTCLTAMREACTQADVTVKHRIGIDDLDSESFLHDFVGEVSQSGCKTFIVHARKAILQGLSPKENREIPPLNYERVYRLKKLFPNLEIIINGGIKTIKECQEHLEHVDGVMIGREAYQHPWLLAEVDTAIYQEQSSLQTRHDIVRAMYPYIERQLAGGQKLSYITRHMLGIFHGQKGGKQFRRYLSENAHKPGADSAVLEQALSYVS